MPTNTTALTVSLTRSQAMQVLISLGYRLETMKDYELDANLMTFKNDAISAYREIERCI